MWAFPERCGSVLEVEGDLREWLESPGGHVRA